MLINIESKTTEAAIKYFLTQAIASVILIFSFSINFFTTENLNLETTETLIFISLIIKAGLAPFHF